MIVNGKYLLKKFAGKGGWTYIDLPHIKPNKNTPFGWVTVSGFIDRYEITQCKLMPKGNGTLFLPVKKEIRKKIGKEFGDYVTVKLYIDTSKVKIPKDIIDCFNNEPEYIYNTFLSYNQGEQKAFLDWINNAKTIETKINRIVTMIEKLKYNKSFYDK